MYQTERYSERLELGSISSSTYLNSDQNWVWTKVLYFDALYEVATSYLNFLFYF